MHLRVTDELLATMRKAAAHCGLSLSEIVWKACRSLSRVPDTETMREKRRRVGTFLDVPHVCAPDVTKTGKCEIQVRGELPPGLNLGILRERIYDKCVAALGVRVQPFRTNLREGVDYLVAQSE